MEELLRLVPVLSSDKAEFLSMATQYFTELNSNFVPQRDWEANYFQRLQDGTNLCARWIVVDERRIGFSVYGVENHRFLPRTIGCIYEFYVLPSFRRSGIGMQAAMSTIKELRNCSPAKIQLEVLHGNESAQKFWNSLGFRKVSERFVLDGGDK